MTENHIDIGTSTLQPEMAAETSLAEEKLLPQSKVNELVGDAKSKGYQKGYQQALVEAQSKTVPQNTPTSMSNDADPTDIKNLIASEFAKQQQRLRDEQQKQMQEDAGKRVLNELSLKIKDAEPRYSDFNDVTSKVDFTKIPEVLHYANIVDNSGDVLYDLAKNPSKIGILRSLPPDLAAMEVQRLSHSIKQNQTASATSTPPQPLSQVKSSNIGIGTGPKTAADYRKYFKGKV